MALDYGSARTGVAVSDPTGMIARPLCVVERRRQRRGPRRAARASSRDEDAERVVVGLPLTLRGERGRAGARETEQFARRSGSGSRCRSCSSTSASRPTSRSRRAGTRRGCARGGASPLGLPRVVERRARRDAAEPGPPPRQVSRAASRRRSAVVLVGRSWSSAHARVAGRERGATADDDRQRRRRSRSGSSSRRGSRARRWRSACRRWRRSPSTSRTRRCSCRGRGYLRCDRSRGDRRASAAKKRPLEGFLFPATYDFLRKTTSRAARSATSSRRSRELEEGRPLVCAQEEPHAVRRADHRVDRREARRSRRRAAEGRRGDLQPAARRACARDRRDDPLRAARPGDEVAARSRSSKSDNPYNTRNPRRACRRRRSATRGSRRCRRPRIPRTATGSTSSASRTRCITTSPANYQRLPQPRAPVRLLRLVALLGHPGRALALAPDAERGVRGARARLGLRRARRRRRSGSRRRCAARRARVRRRERTRRTSSRSRGSSAASCRP